MSDDNMEKNFPEGAADENGVPETKTETGGDWQWDASVPETQTTDITFEDLGVAEKTEESAPEAESETEAEEAVTEDTAEPEAAEEEPAEPKLAYSDDDGLCVYCGNPREDSPSDLYCKECREKFLRTDYGAGHIILAFVMVIVAAIGYFVCSATGSIASNVMKAESCLSEKHFDDAAEACSDISDDVNTINTGINAVFTTVNKSFAAKEWFGTGSKTTKLMLEAYADIVTIGNGEHENFVSTVDASVSPEDLAKPEYAKIKKVYDFCKEILTVGEEYMGGIQKFISYDSNSNTKIDYAKAIKYVDGLEAETTAEKCMADYCRFLAAFYADKDSGTVLGFYENLYNNAGEFAYIFTQTYMDASAELKDYDRLKTVAEKAIERNANDTSAYYYSITAYIYTNEFDTALAKCEELKKANPDGLDYYSLKANILRRQSKFDEALKVCKNGLEEGEDAEIYRQQAIVYMLQDNKDSALEAIKQAYDITLQGAYAGEYVSMEILNTAAVITCICGDEETYNEIVELFENENVEFDKTVTDCVKGEITFEEIFMEGTGEI